MRSWELVLYALVIPLVGTYFSLKKGKKPINYIFLVISLALYYGALFNVRYL
jgi:peptide/nickel transport system permease protein